MKLLRRTSEAAQTSSKTLFERSLKEGSESKHSEPKLDMEALHLCFDEWQKHEENLSGVLNNKALNLKNLELIEKLKYWRETADLRQETTQRIDEKQNQVLELLTKYVHDMSIDKDKVENCQTDFFELIDKRKIDQRNENTLNDFLLRLKEFKILEIRDFKKCLDKFKNEFYDDQAMLNEFVEKVCRECVLNQHYFSLFDLPDFIVKISPSKADYKKMLELLQSVKSEYIKEKADILKKPIDDVKITDEDLVPLDLIKHVLGQKRYKFNSTWEYLNGFLKESQEEVNKKIQQLQVENNKIKQTIENNVFIAHLNKVMEDTHSEVFVDNYKIRVLHLVLNKSLLKSAKEVAKKYFDIIQVNPSNNKEIKDRLTKEIAKFNNKTTTVDVSDTISDLGEDKLAKVFKRLDAFREIPASERKGDESELEEDMSPGKGPNKEVKFESIIVSGRSKDSLFDKGLDTGYLGKDFTQPPGENVLDSFKIDNYKPPEHLSFDKFEEEDEEDKEKVAERKRKEAEEAAWMAKYLDPDTGEPFNPIKKFGLIESDYLVYDKVTSSYPLNLPTDYYQRYIKETLPSKKTGKWFIRPHHVEKLTTHVKSIKDDVLNTQYYSHYHDESKNKVKRDEMIEAIGGLENKIDDIKNYIKTVKMGQGTWDPDEEEEVYNDPDLQKEARRKFETFLYDGKREDKKKLMISAFEGLLYEMRRIEKEMLNLKRAKEYEKNRPPQDYWYMLKTEEFNKELYRNRMALKPNNENKVYLNNLQDPYLY